VASRPRFGLGTIVRHRDFGRGRIVAFDDERYVILFPGGDAKTVAFTFDGLEAQEVPVIPSSIASRRRCARSSATMAGSTWTSSSASAGWAGRSSSFLAVTRRRRRTFPSRYS